MESILVAVLVGGFLAMMLPMAIVPLLGTGAPTPAGDVRPTSPAVLGRTADAGRDERMAA